MHKFKGHVIKTLRLCKNIFLKKNFLFNFSFSFFFYSFTQSTFANKNPTNLVSVNLRYVQLIDRLLKKIEKKRKRNSRLRLLVSEMLFGEFRIFFFFRFIWTFFSLPLIDWWSFIEFCFFYFNKKLPLSLSRPLFVIFYSVCLLLFIAV